MPKRKKPKLLIFIVAYNAEKTIEKVLSRIPAGLVDDYRVEVLIIDDASPDATFEQAIADPWVQPAAAMPCGFRT